MMTNGIGFRAAGVGIYTLPEAAHLLKASTSRVRRWLLGYRFPTKSEGPGESAPIFQPELPVIDGHWAIAFLDLVELLFIKAFRDEGVSLQTIRKAAGEAARRWGSTHPFCLKRFATDGKSIFATLQDDEGDDALLELTRSQYCFKSFLSPYLKQLDYGKLGDVNRWWPLGKKGGVCLDPHIAFGRPVMRPSGVPTEAIFQAVQANESEKEVADWMDLPVQAVRAAVKFERSLVA